MKKVWYLLAALLMPGIPLLTHFHAHAATDGAYTMYPIQSGWDGKVTGTVFICLLTRLSHVFDRAFRLCGAAAVDFGGAVR